MRVHTPYQSFSQCATSFFGTICQDILYAPFFAFIRVIRRCWHSRFAFLAFFSGSSRSHDFPPGCPSGPLSGNCFVFPSALLVRFLDAPTHRGSLRAAESLPTVCVISYSSSCNLSICRAYRLDAHFLYSSLKLHSYLVGSLLGIFPLWRGLHLPVVSHQLLSQLIRPH